MAQHSADGMARIVRRVPPGLDVARERLMRLVDEARVVAGNLPPSKVVLGGFSQVRWGWHVFFFLGGVRFDAQWRSCMIVN